MMKLLFDTTDLELEQRTLLNEAQDIADRLQQCINENAHAALDQAAYNQHFDELSQRFEQTNARRNSVIAEIQRRQTQRAQITAFLKSFKSLPDTITEFTPEIWQSLTDFATVYSKDDIRFTFKNGQEIQA